MYYLHTDHLFTPRFATNDTKQIIWRWEGEAFGETEAEEDVDRDGVLTTVNLRFPGQYYDGESGLHYNYFRTYDPNLGRYITSDPIGLLGGINTYAYVGGNPLYWVDPLGLAPSWVGPTQAVLGVTAGMLIRAGIMGNPYAGIAGLTLTAVVGGLQLWDVNTPIEQINSIKDSESMNQIRDNMNNLQDLIDNMNEKGDSCPTR